MKKLIIIAILGLSSTLVSFTVIKKAPHFNNEVVYMGGHNINGQNTTNANPIAPLLNTAAYHDVQNKLIITPGTGIGVAFNSDSSNITITNLNGLMKRQETYSGITNASGNVTLTFSPAYSVAPNIQANIINGTNTNLIKIGTPTTTGVTVNVVNRTDVVGLLPTYSNVTGAAVDILVTSK
jgi:hypothetical protein